MVFVIKAPFLSKAYKRLLVVEHIGDDDRNQRVVYWRRMTGFSELELIQKEEILEFTDWPLM